MRTIKMLCLLAVTVAAPMAFAGSASATITSNGSAYTGEIVAGSTNTELDGSVDVKCKYLDVAGSTSNGATTFDLHTVHFTECGADTVFVTSTGSWEFASDGTLSWEDLEFTILTHRTVFGFPITTHCIYSTGPTLDVGTLTEGTTTITFAGTNIPQKTTDTPCGSNAQLTGTLTISQPGALSIH